MSDHEDAFCPMCDGNIGFGTLEIIGCPLCGYMPDEDDDNLEEEFEEIVDDVH